MGLTPPTGSTLLQAGEDPARIRAEEGAGTLGEGSDTLTLPCLHPPLAEGVRWGSLHHLAASPFSTGSWGGGRGNGRVSHHGDTPLPAPSAPSTLAPGHQDKAPQGQRPTGSTAPNHPGGRGPQRGKELAWGCAAALRPGWGGCLPPPTYPLRPWA